jgi:hypothetical protein
VDHYAVGDFLMQVVLHFGLPPNYDIPKSQIAASDTILPGFEGNAKMDKAGERGK